MPITPLIPVNPSRQQTYPWYGKQSQPNSLALTNGATLTVLDAAGDSVKISPTTITVVRGASGGSVPIVPPVGSATQPQIQAALSNVTSNGSGQGSVSFPFAFPTACDSVVLTIVNGSNSNTGMGVVSVTASQFTYYVYVSGATFAGAFSFYWIAFGH